MLLTFTCLRHAACLFLPFVGFFGVSFRFVAVWYLFAMPFCLFLLLLLGLWLTFIVCPLSFYKSAALNILECVQEFLSGENPGGMSLDLGACIFHFPRESGVAFQVVRPCHVLGLVSGDTSSWLRPLCLPCNPS